MKQSATIEYFYSAHSAFAYIGSERFMQIAAKSGRTIVHRPVILSPVVEAAGAGGFRQRTTAQVQYHFGRQIERWSEFRDVPIVGFRPRFHDEDMRLPSGLLIAAQELRGDVDRLAHLILRAHWRDDADISDEKLLKALVVEAGMNGEELFNRAAGDDIAVQLKANTDEAIERSVFGSPTYFVDGDMFYGQDQLELVERTLEKPFAGTWPRG